MKLTNQDELDNVTLEMREHFIEIYPDVGFVIVAVGGAGDLGDQAFAVRSNADELAHIVVLLARAIAWAAHQDTAPRIVRPEDMN